MKNINEEGIIQERQNFDLLMAKFNSSNEEYIYLLFVRDLYVACKELSDEKLDMKEFIRIPLNLIKLVFYKPILSVKGKTILYQINEVNDRYISEKIDVPISKILYKRKLNIKSFCYFPLIFKLIFILMREKQLNKILVLKILKELITSVNVYKNLDLSGIEKIITQRDRYPEELAFITKAKNENIKTVRIENFPCLGTTTRDRLYCEYYFCPNSLNKKIFSMFEFNKDVKYVDGGFVFWDTLGTYSYNPVSKPKVISFWTQYGFEMGIFGEYGPEFYIKEILAVIPDDFILYIKAHPLEDAAKYSKYQSDKVKVIKHGEMNNAELISMSYYIFSINSFSTFEAKHICENSFYINYKPEEQAAFDYALIEDFVDVIKNRSSLEKILNGETKVKDRELFIKYFNPTFPESTKRLKEFIEEL